MELNTFGAALRAALEKEQTLIQCYEAFLLQYADQKIQGIIDYNLSAAEKRLNLIQRNLQQNVYSDMDSGVFEPIERLDSTSYFIATCKNEMNKDATLRQVAKIEKILAKFYSDFLGALSFHRKSFKKELQQNVNSCLENCRRIEEGSKEGLA